MIVASDFGVLSSGEWICCSAVDVNEVNSLLQKQLAGPEDMPGQLWGTLFLGLSWAVASEEKAQVQRRNKQHDPFEACSEDTSDSVWAGHSPPFSSFTEMKKSFGLGEQKRVVRSSS